MHSHSCQLIFTSSVRKKTDQKQGIIHSKHHKIKFKLKRGNPSRVDTEEQGC
ncbi:hypothetical protein GYH30_003112 [Glycine max]|nr:hypothetical protein GYH30_003112 [Glycine max]